MPAICYELKHEQHTQAFGQALAHLLMPGLVIGLQGEIGRGKTSLVRACLQALGVTAAVKSPTFTLVESYELPTMHIHHFDLYRLQSQFELEDLGFRDYLTATALCFIEWPEKSPALHELLDLNLHFELQWPGRRLSMTAQSALGKQMLTKIQRKICID